MGNLRIHIVAHNHQGQLISCHEIFVWKKDEDNDNRTYLDFCYKLVLELIENNLLKAEREEKEENFRLLCKLHDHVPSPPNAT